MISLLVAKNWLNLSPYSTVPLKNSTFTGFKDSPMFSFIITSPFGSD